MKENLQLFKEMYTYEQERKEKTNSRISIPVGVVFLLAGAVFFYLSNINNLIQGFWKIVFYFCFVVYIFSIILIIVLLIRAYYGYNYHYMPYASDIDKYTNELCQYFDDNYEVYFKQTGSTKEELIINRLDEHLYNYYRDASTINAKLNDKKLTYLRKVGWLLILALISGILSIAPFYLSLKKKSDIIQKVEITNLKDILFKGGDIMIDNQTPNPNSNPQAQTPPPEPTPPSLRAVNENFSIDSQNGNSNGND